MITAIAILLLAALVCVASFHHKWLSARSQTRVKSNQISRSIVYSTTSSSTTENATKLTQKEYLIAIRNRLFAINEMIWLHEYAMLRPGVSKIEPLSVAKYNELQIARGELLDEYPTTKLYNDLKDAQSKNLTYAAIYIDRMINNFNRQIPIPLLHVNQIAVLSFSGQVINLMRGQGAVYHRLLPSNILTERGVKRQFQHPSFSNMGKYVAFIEMHFKETTIVRSDAIVFEVPNDPKTYGTTDNMPIFDSGELPGAPFFLRFSPDDESLVMLCTSQNGANNNEQCTSLIMLDWGKYHRKDSWVGVQSNNNVITKSSPRKVLTLLQGNPVFFSYTTSNSKNATIVAHCQKEIEDPTTKSMKMEKAVWILQRQDTGGVKDFIWKKISDGDQTNRWSTPICHSAGGGDNVMIVEDGYLVTKAISRWKRDSQGISYTKKLLPVKGQVQFLVSPDNSKVVVLQEDINSGHYSLTVIEGEDALDPANAATGKVYEIPNDKVTVAFWFSPDSSKLLSLCASDKFKSDITNLKNNLRVGLNSVMQWNVYNFVLNESKDYEVFKPTPYFMKTYVPFFSQYAQVYNPWAPDSKSFIYITAAGLIHTPLVGSKHCLGEDAYMNQGATFGTWSRM